MITNNGNDIALTFYLTHLKNFCHLHHQHYHHHRCRDNLYIQRVTGVGKSAPVIQFQRWRHESISEQACSGLRWMDVRMNIWNIIWTDGWIFQELSI